MKKGLELLFSRSLNSNIDVEALEAIHNITLPPLYKIFIKSFIIGDNNILCEKTILDSAYKNAFTYFIYEPNPDIIFSGFNEIEKALGIRHLDDTWMEKKYLPIGYCGFNGGVLLGTTESDKDKIIIEMVDLEPRFSILAENIFEFVRGLVLVSNSKVDIDKTKLYKNWGEDFWRIREDEKGA